MENYLRSPLMEPTTEQYRTLSINKLGILSRGSPITRPILVEELFEDRSTKQGGNAINRFCWKLCEIMDDRTSSIKFITRKHRVSIIVLFGWRRKEEVLNDNIASLSWSFLMGDVKRRYRMIILKWRRSTNQETRSHLKYGDKMKSY